ncbi:MAG: hypothetical protein FJ296_04895 [Planctomycetes bacterium]|nr:hypothetical protein [Planctomycetota bacterium]
MTAPRTLLALALLTLSVRPLHALQWAHYQHDAAHTGRTAAAVKPAKLASAWSAPGYTGALILGRTLYAKSRVGLSTAVSAFSLVDGQVQWTWPGDDIYFGNLAVAGDFVLLEGFDFGDGTTDTLTLIDKATGQLLDKLPLPLSFSFLDPAVECDPATGDVLAWFSDGSTLACVHVDPGGQASVLWTATGDLGGSSAPTLVGDSVIVFGSLSASAFDQATGAQNQFFVDPLQDLGNGAPVAWNASRGEFYVRMDHASSGLTRVRAFRYDGQDAISPLWTKETPLQQYGGLLAIGPDDRLYVVRSGEIAVLDPDDGSTLKSLPFPYANGCSPVLSRRVLWVHSETQTFARNSRTLGLLKVFEGSAGFGLGLAPLGAITPGVAALNVTGGGSDRLDVYR